MDCSQAQVWIADLDRNGVKEICVSGDPCLTTTYMVPDV